MATFGTQHLRSLLTELPVRWRGTLIVAIPVTCLFMAVGSFAVLQRSTEADQKYLTHSQEKLLQANRLLKILVDAETGVRGYGLSREPSFLDPYNSALNLLPDTVKKLSSLTQDNPQQSQKVQQIRVLVREELSFLKQNLQAFKIASAKGVPSQNPQLLVKGKVTLDNIRGLVADFSAQEQLHLKQHNQQLETQRLLTTFVLGASATIGCIGALAAIYLFDQLDRQLTERQIRLRHSKARLQAILDNVVDGIIILDQEGNIQSLNQSAEQMFEHEPTQILGKNLKRLLGNTFSGSSSEILSYFLGGDLSAKIGCYRETVGRRQNGTTFPMELVFSEMKLDNQRLFIAIVRDITLRKQSEETLRKQATLLDLANDTIIVRNWHERITYWNQGATLLYGFSPQETIGECIHALLQTVFPEPLETIKAVLIEQGYWKGELIHTKRDGTQITVASQWTLQVDEEGEPSSILEISNDITDRKLAEVALQRKAIELAQLSTILAQTNTILEKRNQELDQFAYIVSHDLKAPLRAIANLSSWIEEDIQDRLDEETRHQMDLLRGRVHRMENLIEGLLQYSRVGRVKTSQEQVNVETLLAEVVDSLAPPSAFTITVTNPMPTLETERLPLEQVFANLISNAIKHHNRPDGHITISSQDQGAFWAFTVADDGPGIAPQYHEKVFAIFQTLESQDKVDSTGIGLSLVKKIVESQGGTLDLESQVGQGATFRFTWLKTNSQSELL